MSSRGVSGEFADCATYDVEKDTWAPIPASATLTAREYLTAIAAPGGVLLWGGYSYNASSTYGDGATFDAANGALSAMSGVGAPLPRYHHAAAWTGESMIVFGGSDLREGMWLGRGGVYFP